MKHLRKFNESKSDFIDYIKDCFVDFLDLGSESDSGEDSNGRQYYEIFINLPGVSKKNDYWDFEKRKTLEDNLKHAEQLVEFYKDIDNCIDKVKIKYPNVETHFDIEKEGNTSDSITGKYTELFDATVMLTLVEGKNVIKKPMKKGLNTIKFSELGDTWDIESEN